jgi:transcriptional regulator with XRE-family HTH domain
MENVGTKVKRMRELRNYSQEYVADKIGISQSNYARLEKNEVAISDERLKAIAHVLGTTEDAIKAFDDSIIFNITQGPNSAAGLNCEVHNYQISPEIKQLYEDKIKLLEEKILSLQSELKNRIQNK